MKPELEQKLIEDFPKLYTQCNWPMTDTAMCWGFPGNGWYNLIYKLSKDIQDCIDLNGYKQVEAVQVKEKFGGLRYYVDSATEDIWDLIDVAEQDSYTICEVCGKPGKLIGGGWMRTLCEDCNDEA